MVRLKGVGRSPLSVARVGLLAVGPERVRGRRGEGTERKKERQKMNETVKIYCEFFYVGSLYFCHKCVQFSQGDHVSSQPLYSFECVCVCVCVRVCLFTIKNLQHVKLSLSVEAFKGNGDVVSFLYCNAP